MLKLRWQNLTDGVRSLFEHGRAWLNRTADGEARWPPILKIEWSHGARVHGAALQLDFDREDREITLHVKAPLLFSYFVTVSMPRMLVDGLPWSYPNRGEYGGWDRTIGVRVFSGAIWFSFWEDGMDWRSSDPKWMRRTIHVDDLVFGKSKHESHELEAREVVIPMPERAYKGTAKLTRDTWTRPRWPWRPFSREIALVHIEVPGGIGKPGKGENDWDCGPDATYGITVPAVTIEDGIGKLVASVFRDRRRHGGGYGDTGGHDPSPPPPSSDLPPVSIS